MDSIARMGFNRSQVVSHLLHPHVTGASQIGQIYTRLKDDKLSKTASQGRVFSQQNRPHHNLPVFRDPSQENRLDTDESDNHLGAFKAVNDYNVGGKSPRVSAMMAS